LFLRHEQLAFDEASGKLSKSLLWGFVLETWRARVTSWRLCHISKSLLRVFVLETRMNSTGTPAALDRRACSGALFLRHGKCAWNRHETSESKSLLRGFVLETTFWATPYTLDETSKSLLRGFVLETLRPTNGELVSRDRRACSGALFLRPLSVGPLKRASKAIEEPAQGLCS